MPLTTPSHYVHNRQPVSGGTVKYWRKDRFGFTPVDGSPYPDTAAADYTATTVADGSWPQGTLAAGDYYVSLEATGLVRSWTGDLIAPAPVVAANCWPDGTEALPGWPRCTDLDNGLVGLGNNAWGLVAGGKLVVGLTPGELDVYVNRGTANERQLRFTDTLRADYNGTLHYGHLIQPQDYAHLQPGGDLFLEPGGGAGQGYIYYKTTTASAPTTRPLFDSVGNMLATTLTLEAGTGTIRFWAKEPGASNPWQLLGQGSHSGGVCGYALDDLTDVAISSPVTAQVPRYNGSNFVNALLATTDLSNWSGTTPTDGQVAVFRTSDNKWHPEADPGGSGGGAPTAAEYVSTASDGTLSAEVVIPGLAGSADIAGAAGGGVGEEYDTSTTGLTWTPSTPATVDSDTTAKSHLYANTTDTTERLGLRSWSPGSGAFDARCHFTAGGTTYNGSGLIVTDAGSNNRLMVVSAADIGNRKTIVQAFTYTGEAYTQRGTDWTNADARYLRISRDGSNNVSFWWSKDGLAWNLIATQAFTLTVANLGYRAALSGAGNGQMYSDWLRTDV